MTTFLTKSKFILILICCTCSVARSQTLNDTLSSNITSRALKAKNPVNSLQNRQSYEYEFCDEDGDGFMDINIATIERDVLANEGVEGDDQEAILISTRNGQIVKFNYPYSNSNVENICIGPLAGVSKSDVGVDENGIIYPCTFSNIYKLDLNACDGELQFSFSFGTDLNALSFDTNGNLYYGIGASSKVYRYDADESTAPYVWHDFVTGGSGGDFVMLNGKLYIAWKIGSSYKLYEVTVDADINYVSHIDLGELPGNTYGLASEFGKLYGVTPNTLYQINLETFTFSTILNNDGAYGDWWGAAGLHEAIEFEVNTYANMLDASSQNNEISDTWTNTQAEGQIIYVRVDNITQNTFEIFPVTISIGRVPQLTIPSDLFKCSNDSNSLFDLTEVENELLTNVNHDVEVSYFESPFNLENDIGQIDTDFESPNSFNIIYVKVKNTMNDCYASSSFVLVNRDAPNLSAFALNASERSLTQCYINSSEQGYFKLNEIYSQVISNPDPENEIQFFSTLSNAQNNIFELNPNYISTVGVTEELFIKVTNSYGCSEITNFFIDGDCVLTTTDLTNLFFPAYFTPNDDSYHDYWNVKGVSQLMRSQSKISIFNRYGKLLISFRPSQLLGWDGTFGSYNMPSDDYWFIMTTFDGKEYAGHFSLKR